VVVTGRFAVNVDITGSSDGVDVGAEEEKVDDDVDDLEEDAVLPRGFFVVVVMMRHVSCEWWWLRCKERSKMSSELAFMASQFWAWP
jgi:hypothetical protein